MSAAKFHQDIDAFGRWVASQVGTDYERVTKVEFALGESPPVVNLYVLDDRARDLSTYIVRCELAATAIEPVGVRAATETEVTA